MQVDGIKRIGQGVIKFSTGLVVINGDHGLAFDAKSLTGRRLVHHSVDTGILTAGNGFKELEHSQDRFSTRQVGLSLSARIGGIGPEDMINVTSFAADGLHRFSTPGISLLQSSFLDCLIVHLLNVLGVLVNHFHIQALVHHDLSAGLTGISTQTFESEHSDHGGIATAIDDLLTT